MNLTNLPEDFTATIQQLKQDELFDVEIERWLKFLDENTPSQVRKKAKANGFDSTFLEKMRKHNIELERTLKMFK